MGPPPTHNVSMCGALDYCDPFASDQLGTGPSNKRNPGPCNEIPKIQTSSGALIILLLPPFPSLAVEEVRHPSCFTLNGNGRGKVR